MGFLREGAQTIDLHLLAGRIRRRESELGLQLPHLLGDLEALGHDVDDGSVKVVDAVAHPCQLGWHGLRLTGHVVTVRVLTHGKKVTDPPHRVSG